MMRSILVLFFPLLTATAIFAQPPDTLFGVRQWTVAEGGNDHYFAILTVVTSTDSARAIAAGMTVGGKQGYLASVTSADENAFIMSLISDDTLPPVLSDQDYLGGHPDCYDDTCAFRWDTDSLGDCWWYDNWAQDQPSGDGGRLGIKGDSYGAEFGTWNDFGSFAHPSKTTVGRSSNSVCR